CTWIAEVLVFTRLLLPNFARKIASNGKTPSGGGHGAGVAGGINLNSTRFDQLQRISIGSRLFPIILGLP
ncbi:MAG: hypothetical protein B6242_15390, partial [Anaerolineaceae bacterium 4572_78]